MDSTLPDHPRLRPIESFAVPGAEGLQYCLRDPSGDSEAVLMLSETALWILSRLDGTRDIGDLQADFCRASGVILPRETIRDLVVRLDEACFLDSPGFHERKRKAEEEFMRDSRRAPIFAGKSYEEDPGPLASRIDGWIESGKAVGGAGTIRALIAPHIDPARGAAVYGSAYRSLRGHPARRIVLLGISHAGGEFPYAACAKDYGTPLGDCSVDGDAIRRLCTGLPFDPLAEQMLHRREHSIEFQALFLRHVLEGWNDRRIVPILCSFAWHPRGREDLLPYPETWRKAFVERLVSILDRETLIVAGVDFSHVGRRFGDAPGGVRAMQSQIEQADRAMIKAIADGDLEGFREGIDREQDARRICGYPAIVTLLEALGDARGSLLDYGQALDESIDSLVSLGAMLLR